MQHHVSQAVSSHEHIRTSCLRINASSGVTYRRDLPEAGSLEYLDTSDNTAYNCGWRRCADLLESSRSESSAARVNYSEWPVVHEIETESKIKCTSNITVKYTVRRDNPNYDMSYTCTSCGRRRRCPAGRGSSRC